MTAIILADASENQIAAIALAFQARQKSDDIKVELDWKAIAQSVSESIRDMRGGHEDLHR